MKTFATSINESHLLFILLSAVLKQFVRYSLSSMVFRFFFSVTIIVLGKNVLLNVIIKCDWEYRNHYWCPACMYSLHVVFGL